MAHQRDHRYFANPKEPLRAASPHDELLASLSRINAYNPPVHTCSTGWTFHGFYMGPTSIAYLFYRLSLIYPDLQFKQQSLLDWAEEYLKLGSLAHKKPPTPSHCGIANETLAYLALSAVMRREESLAKQLCSLEPVINAPKDNGSNEWLYGRAGYLYFLRLCRTAFNEDADSATASLLATTIEKTVRRVLDVPQPWAWRGKRYLGAAHGTIGVICQVVLSLPSVAPQLESLLSQVLDMQYDSGNFPSSLPAGSDKLVQFCHGGPGIVISLRSLKPHFPKLGDKIERAIVTAQADIWERGILRKEPCLCHGVASNALALDSERRFGILLSCMCTDSMEKLGWMKERGRNDEFSGLWTGEAGR